MGEPRERPILFSGPMIRAIDAGRKTQTRRVVRGQKSLAPGATHFRLGGLTGWAANDSAVREEGVRLLSCPYGVGDRLWVRESLRWSGEYARWEYAADGLALQSPPALWSERCAWTERVGGRSHVPSIHMPRWAARLTLRVTSVGVERVQAISEEDARAEGVDDGPGRGRAVYPSSRAARNPLGHRAVFAELWDSINGKRAGCSWRDNPFVWAVGFEVERRA